MWSYFGDSAHGICPVRGRKRDGRNGPYPTHGILLGHSRSSLASMMYLLKDRIKRGLQEVWFSHQRTARDVVPWFSKPISRRARWLLDRLIRELSESEVHRQSETFTSPMSRD